MNKLKFYTVIGIVFTLIVGTLMHFVYEWSNSNPVIGFVSAINESVWEHMKLIFFPMLIYSFFMGNQLKNQYPCVSSALNFGMLVGTVLMPAIFYTYTGILGYNLMILDIGTFIISVLISFFSIYKLTLSCKLEKYQIPLNLTVLLFALCFIIFTYNPLNIGIFIDPAK